MKKLTKQQKQFYKNLELDALITYHWKRLEELTGMKVGLSGEWEVKTPKKKVSSTFEWKVKRVKKKK